MNAVPKGKISSPLRGIGEYLRHSYVIRLTIAGAILGASTAGLCVYANPGITWRNPIAHSLLEMCGLLVTGGIIYCLWVQYRVTTERKALLATTAFSGLLMGEFAHVVTSGLAQFHASALYKWGLEYHEGWKIAAALILIASARTSALGNKQTCRRTGIRTLCDSIIISFIIAGVLTLIGRSEHVYAHLLRQAGQALSSQYLAHVFAAVFMGAALLVFIKRYVEQEDAFSDGLSRCLLLAVTSQGAWMMSSRAFDLAWWTSHVLAVVALLELLIDLAIEFGTSYADAQARVEHLEAVHHISSSLNNTLDLRVVMLVLASDIAEMLSARFASVMLADDAGETLRTVATHGLPESPLKSSDPQRVEGSGRPGFYSGHAARAFNEKKVCVVEDVHTDVEFVPWRLLAQHNGYAVSVPLVYQDVALGVLNMFFDLHIPINGERIRLFETLASGAAVAIANAQLYDRTLSAEVAAEIPFRRLKIAS